MTNMAFQREKQLKKWRKQKQGVERSAALRYLLGVYSHVPEVVFSGENIELDKYLREFTAYEFRQFLLNKRHLEYPGERITRRFEECKQELVRYQAELDRLNSAPEPNMHEVFTKPGEALTKQIELEAAKERAALCIGLTEKKINAYNIIFELHKEVKDAAEKEVQGQRRGEFRIFAQENLKMVGERDLRKINLPPELEKMARFAFLLPQWERAERLFKKKWHPKRKDYWEPLPGENPVSGTYQQTEFLKKQDKELELLLGDIAKISGFREKFGELVRQGYIDERQARQAASYLEIAARCPEKYKGQMHSRWVLGLCSAVAESNKPQEKRLTGEEIRMLIPGLSKDLTETLSRSLKEETLLTRHANLTDILSEEISQQIFSANPNLLLECDKMFDDYLRLMGQYISGEEAKETALQRIGHETQKFSDIKELKRLVYSRHSKAPPISIPTQRANEYDVTFKNAGYDLELVEAMITRGMRLNKKYFGESYIPGRYVFKNMRTFFKKNPKSVGDFDRTRDWLVSQGVIIHHQGKGKSKDESTVSLNPHLSEIKWAPLREYVGEIFSMYGILPRNDDN
jgi:hypothetical protein